MDNTEAERSHFNSGVKDAVQSTKCSFYIVHLDDKLSFSALKGSRKSSDVKSRLREFFSSFSWAKVTFF